MRQARFTRRTEDFDCAHCHRHVAGDGYTNHCPHCLWSRHVDVNPGDRLADCGGKMRPVGAVLRGQQAVVVHVCENCGHRRPNRVSPADRASVIRELLAVPVPDEPRGSRAPRGPRPPRRVTR